MDDKLKPEFDTNNDHKKLENVLPKIGANNKLSQTKQP
jgi:hypothetical protein